MKQTNPTQPTQTPILSEGIHYYYDEQGYWVFTALYLQQRGFCCGNGCKHCPYRKRRDEEKEEGKK